MPNATSLFSDSPPSTATRRTIGQVRLARKNRSNHGLTSQGVRGGAATGGASKTRGGATRATGSVSVDMKISLAAVRSGVVRPSAHILREDYQNLAPAPGAVKCAGERR